MKEAGTDPTDGAVGGRDRPATVSENEREKLAKRYADQAKEDQGASVRLLSQALEVVVSDLGNGSLADLINVAWMPAFHLGEVGPPWGGQSRSREDPMEDGSWAGIVYLRGRRSLVIEVAAAYVESYREQLPFLLAQAIQDTVIAEVREARPACPLHGHPLNPVATPTGSFWECPDGAGIWSCAMGSYHQALSD
jgi:hypothetical protein